VSIELFRTTGRELEQASDGAVRNGALTDLDGVEVCATKQRAAFSSFRPFTDLDPARCATSLKGQTLMLSGLPANSDLVITYRKDGYRFSAITFRTDDYDVAAPAWGSLSHELLREGATEPWLEPEARASTGDGVVAIGAVAVWAGAAVVAGGQVINVVDSRDVSVEIEDAEGRLVRELSSLRDSPPFLSLPEGSYAFRYSHPRMHIRPVGATAQYLIAGLSTAALDTIEVPVLAGHDVGAVVDALCAAPHWDQPVSDLPTCTLASNGVAR